MLVYKAVEIPLDLSVKLPFPFSPTKGPFVSAIVQGYSRSFYTLGKTTHTKPTFAKLGFYLTAFINLEDALDFAGKNCPTSTILLCEAKDPMPLPPLRGNILSLTTRSEALRELACLDRFNLCTWPKGTAMFKTLKPLSIYIPKG